MIVFRNVSFAYSATQVFSDLNLSLEEDRINCILGPSGCGKSTLLNMLSGDIFPQSGKIENAEKRVSYVFQSPRLVPQITVLQNLDLILKSVVKDKAERRKRIVSALELVELENSGDMYPVQLSGGMAQRVALARAFLFPSRLLLMDEPFKGLDVALKKSIIGAFLSLYGREKKTVVFVTHDPDEAVTLGDKIFMLSDKPATVLAEFSVSEKQSERKIYDAELGKIKNEIYKISENR